MYMYILLSLCPLVSVCILSEYSCVTTSEFPHKYFDTWTQITFMRNVVCATIGINSPLLLIITSHVVPQQLGVKAF